MPSTTFSARGGLGPSRAQAQERIRNTPAPYRALGTPAWLRGIGPELAMFGNTHLDTTTTSCRIVFPDGRVLQVGADHTGLRLTPGYLAPPSCTGPLAALRRTVEGWKSSHIPWSRLSPPPTAHGVLAQRTPPGPPSCAAHTTTTPVGYTTLTHRLWTMMVEWEAGGTISAYIDSAHGEPMGRHAVCVRSDAAFIKAAKAALHADTPRRMAIQDAFWPLANPLVQRWYARHAPTWIGLDRQPLCSGG